MLNLLAISYTNIGPFKDQTLSLFFEKGNFLIKAPIGTGKSFLFFDGPTFALYKNAARNILNVKSKTGSIKLLFEIDGQTYFILRQLKQGKSKDSVSSQLYMIQESGEEIFQKIKSGSLLQYGVDIGDLLQQKGIITEELTFKNETDLQQHINQLLPPQEVFVSTIFLLQDAQNIFEMQPAERLEVLKNVFGLMGIDESKELLKNKRNEIKYQIKAYQDTSRYEERLKNGLNLLCHTFKKIDANQIAHGFSLSAKDEISELESLKDKLGIQNFTLEESLLSFIPDLQEQINRIKELYQQKRTEKSLHQEQLQKIRNQISTHDATIATHQDRLKKLTQLLNEIDTDLLLKLRNQKTALSLKQQELEAQSESEKFQDFYQQNASNLTLQERYVFSLAMNQQFIQELMSLGTTLKGKGELLDKQLLHLAEKSKIEKEQLKSQLTTLQERKDFFDKQYQDLLAKLKTFEHQLAEEATFSCSEIQGNCPFIRAINKQHFQQRDQEKSLLLAEKDKQEALIKNENFDEKIAQIQQKLNNTDQQSALSTEKKEIEILQQKNQEQISLLRKFLQSIDYKKLGELYQEQNKNATQLLTLEKQIQEQETLIQHQEKYQQEKVQIEATIQQIAVQKSELEVQKKDIDQKLAQLEQDLMKEPRAELQNLQEDIQSYSKIFDTLKNLIEEYKIIQLSLKGLLEDEKHLNILYNILNKELLLFALSEYLPVLSEIINAHLSSVVDYQISIKLKEKSEKLELETKILDEKGEREVKSLSGGQRTILKLVWMLAISSYMKTEMLFLDETVNNLDGETVGKIAGLLNNFVKQRQMKFYTITHNSEIQSMSIWDQTIEIKPSQS